MTDYSELKVELEGIKTSIEDLKNQIIRLDEKLDNYNSRIWGKNGLNERVTRLETQSSSSRHNIHIIMTSILSFLAGVSIVIFEHVFSLI